VDPDADLTLHPDAHTNPDPSFQIKAQTREKVLKKAHIPYILACTVIGKLMRNRIRFQIQLITLMRIRIFI
jgi:hypothetical protein